MAVARWPHMAVQVDAARGWSRKRMVVAGILLLGLFIGDLAVLEMGSRRVAKTGANRFNSPVDMSAAPPPYVPRSEVKVKRSAHVTVIPESKPKRKSYRYRRYRRHKSSRPATHYRRPAVRETAPQREADVTAVEPSEPSVGEAAAVE